MSASSSRQTFRQQRGATLVEALVCVFVVAVALTAALNTVAAARMSAVHMAIRVRGMALATDLMNEIQTRYYAEPDGSGGGLLGIELLELTRLQFDDVDDYDGYAESPPQNADGTAIDTRDWRRTVEVKWVTPISPTTTSNSETGAKRITVTVRYKGAIAAELVSIQTKNPLNQPGRDASKVTLGS